MGTLVYLLLGLVTAGLVGYGFGADIFKSFVTQQSGEQPWEAKAVSLILNLVITLGWPIFWILAVPTIAVEIGKRFKKGGEKVAAEDDK